MTALSRFQALLAASEADCAILSSELNQRYLSDFSYTDGYLLVTPERAYLLADFRYTEAAEAAVSDEWTVLRPTGGMREELARLTEFHGLRRPMVEEESLSYADYTALRVALSDRPLLAGASALLRSLRAVKTEAELAAIERAQAITDGAFSHILSMLIPSMTEREVALELEFYMRRAGAEDVAFDTIAVSGPASSLPHGVPSDIPLRRGFLTMDFGAKLDGYCSDMTRTVVIGHADEEMKRLYDTVLSAQEAALAALREGIGCREIDGVARSVIEAAGYGECFGHSLGHGVGLYIHEGPNLSPRAPEDARLVRGNVVTVEPGIYLAGRYGCRIEDMVCITHAGTVKNFTRSPKELIEL